MQPMGPRNRRISLMANMKFGPIVEEIKENVIPRKQYSLNPDVGSLVELQSKYHRHSFGMKE